MPRPPACCSRPLRCLLSACCAPCLLVRYTARRLHAAVPWRDRVFRHMLCLYSATFLLVLPLLCHNLLHSLFFIKNSYTKHHLKDELQTLNDGRVTQAESFLRRSNESLYHKHHRHDDQPNKTPLDLVISLVTVSRDRHQEDGYKPKYLTQVVAALLKLMQEATQKGFTYSMHLEICNVDFDPGSYEEAKFLSAYVPMIQRFNKTHLTFDNQLEKEKKDYVFCLERAQRFNPRYTLVIEDDALPVDAFFTVLQHTIRSHLDQQYLRGEMRERSEHVAFVKLYHPERLLGYVSYEVERIPEWLAMAVIFSTLCTYFYHRAIKTTHSALLLHILFLAYFLLVLLVIDRANINEFRRFFAPFFYSYVPAPECCTPAMLFPREGARTIVDYLQNIECKKNFGKDIAIRKYILESHDPKWKAYMVQPNLVSHIGMHSALRRTLVDPFIV